MHYVGYYDLYMPMPLCSEHCCTTQMIKTTTTKKTLLIIERPWQPPLWKLKLSPGVEMKLVKVALGHMRGQDTNRLWVDCHTDTVSLYIWKIWSYGGAFCSSWTETREREDPKASAGMKIQVFWQVDAFLSVNSTAPGAPGCQWTKWRLWRPLKEGSGKGLSWEISQLGVFSLNSGYFSFGKIDLELFDPDIEGVLKKDMKYLWSALSFRGSNILVCETEMNSSSSAPLLGPIRGCPHHSWPVLVWKSKNATHPFATFP